MPENIVFSIIFMLLTRCKILTRTVSEAQRQLMNVQLFKVFLGFRVLLRGVLEVMGSRYWVTLY